MFSFLNNYLGIQMPKEKIQQKTFPLLKCIRNRYNNHVAILHIVQVWNFLKFIQIFFKFVIFQTNNDLYGFVDFDTETTSPWKIKEKKQITRDNRLNIPFQKYRK